MKKYIGLIGFILSLMISPLLGQADEIEIIGIDRYNGMDIEVGTNITTVSFTDGLTLLVNDYTLVEQQLLVDTLAVDTNNIGSYPVVYYILFRDNGNNIRHNLVTIHVDVVDTKKPVLSGVKPIFRPVGTPSINYLAGVTATDNDKNSELEIMVLNTENVNLNQIGSYDIAYVVLDKAGNYTEIKTKVVIEDIKPGDNTKPVFTNILDEYLFGENQGVRNYLNGVTATDNLDGDLTSNIQVDDSKVDYTKIGTYYVYFIVSDNSSNVTIESRPVIVRIDNIKPYFVNLSNRNVTVSSDYDLLSGVQALDAVCGDISEEVEYRFIDNFNIDELGTYRVMYFVTDYNGNYYEQEAIINVVDNVKPTITAPDYIDVKINTSFDLLRHVKVTDNFDDSVEIELTGQYNLGKTGSYFISIIATDSSHNTTVKNLFVNVYDVNVNKLENNPIVVGSIVGVIVSGIVTYLGVSANRKRKRSNRR